MNNSYNMDESNNADFARPSNLFDLFLKVKERTYLM